MGKSVQVIVLEVEYDDEEYEAPATWNWSALAEAPIDVLAAGPEMVLGEAQVLTYPKREST